MYKDKIVANCQLLDENKIEELLNIGYDNIERIGEFYRKYFRIYAKEKGLVTGKIPIQRQKLKLKVNMCL